MGIFDKIFKNKEKEDIFDNKYQEKVEIFDKNKEKVNAPIVNKDVNIYDEIKKIIETLELSGDYENIEKFFKEQSFRVVTTNYDKLILKLCGDGECQAISPGMLIPRLSSKVKVYHVHGSIDVPANMIVTSNNYFKFMNSTLLWTP